jgi:hypothetical protein
MMGRDGADRALPKNKTMSTATEKSPLEKIISARSTPAVTRLSNTAELPPAEPCPTCHHGVFWQDGYRGFHCGVCEPAPRPSLIRETFILVDNGGGSGRQWQSLKRLRQATQEHARGDDAGLGDSNIDLDYVERTDAMPDGTTRLVIAAPWYVRRGPREGEAFEEWWERQLDFSQMTFK